MCLRAARRSLSLLFWLALSLKASCALAVDIPLLKQRVAGGPSEWMVEQIASDLAPYAEKGIRAEEIEAYWQRESPHYKYIVRVKIAGGAVEFCSGTPLQEALRLESVRNAFTKLCKACPLPDCELIVNIGEEYSGPLPIFTFAKDKRCGGAILMPDFEALGGYEGLTASILAGNQQYPWEMKIKRAFWRGSSTGGYYREESWQNLPRARLVLCSKQNPRELDARFTSLCQMEASLKMQLSAKGLQGTPSAPRDHLRYRYQIEVDGNTCSYSRCYWELLCNSVMLKQVSNNIQWYYGALQPEEHFIPLKEDLSDLLLKINWARANDRKCREIAERATAFALNELSPEAIYSYLYFLIEAYARLFHVHTQH